MNAPFVSADLRDGVATLTMRHAEARNPLSEANVAALDAALAAAEGEARALILAAEGPTFCAGHDLKEMARRAKEDADAGRAYNRRLVAACNAMMTRLARFPCPTIAQIHAPATAAGAQLVASCDLALIAEEAWLATPGVDIGLFCFTPMAPLSRVVAPRHAMEMLLTGEPVSAARALAMGLVNRVVPAARLGEETRALAAKIASKSPSVVRAGKAAYRRQRGLALEEAYDVVGEAMTRAMEAPSAREGVAAFLERRAPVWPD